MQCIDCKAKLSNQEEIEYKCKICWTPLCEECYTIKDATCNDCEEMKIDLDILDDYYNNIESED